MTPSELPETGVLDTCVLIDAGALAPDALPHYPMVTAITLVELHQGIAMAKDPAEKAKRTEKLQTVVAQFDPIPFDARAAARYGTLAALIVAAGRNPKPRRMDLMIAATASSRGLPLFTRNIEDFKGLGDAVTVHPV
ncbi:type II toxin-antitoxin system VapC family toxin [Nocardiopsis sp. RSe5-2]|uniref:Type II toxin-antitoxin system VapC family toxin n=1 Tax=Nocardiopsis endophytica TaxID=3018445 RepID=A0ABT4UAA1_9ACTN|nr:type II toxin-antitoxin system VapC family toxin [Nocardiopsis endophytica]MDA2813320.1 type II toxin-antitoxin system VapC family toxin [Nocardiopsis endophytica]